MIRLTPDQVTSLNTAPEYRMGYHRVHAILSGGSYEFGYVVNQTIFLQESENPWQMRVSWDYLLAEAAKTQVSINFFRVIPREPETLHGVRQIALSNEKFHVLAERTRDAALNSFSVTRGRLLAESDAYEIAAKNEEAKDAPVTLTSAGEVFKRFSPYPNDRRVTARMGLVAGTFGTTREDADVHVKTGMDAVARYALPSDKPASNVFTIRPDADTDLQRGTVAPANNQPGGGVEVIFVNGSPDGTVTGPATIPDK
jgi:hypothetical protein